LFCFQNLDALYRPVASKPFVLEDLCSGMGVFRYNCAGPVFESRCVCSLRVLDFSCTDSQTNCRWCRLAFLGGIGNKRVRGSFVLILYTTPTYIQKQRWSGALGLANSKFWASDSLSPTYDDVFLEILEVMGKGVYLPNNQGAIPQLPPFPLPSSLAPPYIAATSILVYSEREKTYLTAIIIRIFVYWNLLNF